MNQFEITDPNRGDDYVPSRFKPSNVDRFLPILKKVVTGSREVRFKHDEIGLNANTAMARVRDAALAVTRGKVFYSDLDADVFRDTWPYYKVEYDHFTREVVIVRYKEQSTAVVDNVHDLVLRVDEQDFTEYLTHLAWIYGHGKFRGAVTILGILDESFKQHLQTTFNVFFRQDKPNEHIMT